MAIDAQTAISRLSGVTTEAQLRMLIADVSVESPGKTTLLYSGDFGKDSAGNAIKIWEAIAEAKKNPDIRLIDKTQAAEFLQSEAFKNAVQRIFDSPIEKGTPAYDFIDNSRTGAWAAISELFAKATKGDVVTWTMNATADRVFAVTEIGAVLASDAKTINGLPTSDLKLYWNDALATAGGDIEAARLKMVELMRATSFFNAQGKITLNGETKLIAEFMRAGMAPEALEAQLASGKQALERLDSLEKGLGTKITKAGNILAGLTLLIASAQASAATAKGDYDSAASIMGDWGSKFLGSLAAGYAASTVTGEALAPLALSGPAGATIAFAASLVVGLAGGLYGDQVVGQMLAGGGTEAPVWDTTRVIEFAKRDDAQGLAWRKALYEMNPLVLLSATADPGGQLAMYNLETGQGSITEAWIRDRALMMEQVVAAWRNGTGSGKSWRINTFSTDTIYFEDKASGISLQQINELTGDVNGPSYLYGAASNDTITGGTESDHLYGGGGDDTLDGGKGNDYLEGNAGNDKLTGGEDKDTLLGGAGEDTLEGGKGNDRLEGGKGNDTYLFKSGEGTDWIRDTDGEGSIKHGTTVLNGGKKIADSVWKSQDEKFTYTLNERTENGLTVKDLSITAKDADGVIWIENWKPGQLGIALNDVPIQVPTGGSQTTGDNYSNEIIGSEEANRILALGGNDFVLAHAGSDVIIGGTQDAYPGYTDYLAGDQGDDLIFADDEIDLTALPSLKAFGGEVSDSRIGDMLFGGSGKDQLIGSDRKDLVFGGAGEDLLVGGAGDDVLGGDQDRKLGLSWQGIDHFGDIYCDKEITYDREDGIFGDIYSVFGLCVGPLTNGDGFAFYFGWREQKVFADANGGADMIYGGAGNDRIHGLVGDDVLFGESGDDVMTGDDGADRLFGGDGNDWMTGEFNSGRYDDGSTAANPGDDYLDGGQGNDHLQGENGDDILLGGSGNDILWGDAGLYTLELSQQGDDYLDGADGNDELHGHGGNDWLVGGEGDDLLLGGAGDDSYDVAKGDGVDTIRDSEGKNSLVFADDVDTSTIEAVAGPNGMLVVSYGDSDRVVIEGGVKGSINSFQLGSGAQLSLAEFIDRYMQESVDVSLGGSNVTVAAGAGNDELELYGENVTAYGGAGDDILSAQWVTGAVLNGGAGDDVLIGGSGQDVLVGSRGNDSLYGGHEADIYRLWLGGGLDWIDDGGNDQGRYLDYVGNGEDGGIEEVAGNDYAAIETLIASGVVHADKVVLGAGISAADIAVTGGEEYELVQVRLADGSCAEIQLALESDRVGTGIELVEFSDGSQLSMRQVLALTNADHNLVGSDGADTFLLGAGNDTLAGNAGDDVLLGGTGNDTYVFDIGFGNDTIREDDSTIGNLDRIIFGNSISTDEIEASRQGMDLLLKAGDTSQIRVSSWFADDAHKVEQVAFADGTVWATADIYRQTNLAPVAELAIENQTALEGASFLFVIPADTFSDADAEIGDHLNFSVVQADGSALPTWLSFDAQTRSLSGTPLSGNIGSFSLKVIATDGSGASVSEDFSLTIDAAAGVTLIGTVANDILTGSARNDTLDGGAGRDRLTGGVGNDTYYVDNAGDVVVEMAGEGFDSVISSVSLTLAANVENLVLNGSGNLSGTGNALDNLLAGNAGSNVLNGGAGADMLIGGAGNDTYYVDNIGDVVTEFLSEGTDRVISAISYTLGDNVENLTLSGTDAISGTGNELNNTIVGNVAANELSGLGGNDQLTGGDSADTLLGGSGNDVLNGGLGADVMTGGADNDTYYVDNAGDVVTELANEGTDRVNSTISYTLGDNVENLTLSGSDALDGTGNELNNSIVGNAAANTLSGLGGNDSLTGGDNGDTLFGGIGNDTLNGGLGADMMTGGSDSDTYYVDNIGDVVTEQTAEGTDRVVSTITYALGENLENLTLSGTEAIDGVGNALVNSLVGNAAANMLSGGAGNDILNGGVGADVMAGGLGNDTCYVDDIGDNVIEAANEGTDRVISTISYTLADNLENLSLSGSNAIDGTGNALANSLTGNAASNLLNGGDGNDSLNGAAGLDFLEGMDGNDTLTDTAGSGYFNGGSGADRITGGASADFLLGGTGNDTINTGAGSDLIAFNKGDGYDAIIVGSDAKTISLGGNIAYSDLRLKKAGNDLVLDTGNGEGMALKNWYVGTTNQNVLNLQVISEAMAAFDAASTDLLLNQRVQDFDFKALAGAFDSARTANPGLTSWALTDALMQFHLSASDSVAVGGDLAYQYGRNGTLAGIGLTAGQEVMGDVNFGTQAQDLRPLAGLQEGAVRLS